MASRFRRDEDRVCRFSETPKNLSRRPAPKLWEELQDAKSLVRLEGGSRRDACLLVHLISADRCATGDGEGPAAQDGGAHAGSVRSLGPQTRRYTDKHLGLLRPIRPKARTGSHDPLGSS